MRLFFDENLSSHLPKLLSDVYPGSEAALTVGLGGASDLAVWEYATSGGFVIVTKDEDFQRLSVLRGHPPKVVWIRLGNCAVADVIRLLRFREAQIRSFAADTDSAFLVLG